MRTALLVLLASPAFAAGFRIDTQSGRAVGMGTAVAAMIDDASANFYNPAGLTGAPGFEVQAGDTLIFPQLKYTSVAGETTGTEIEVSPPPHVFARFGVIDQLAVGFGLFVPFGATGNWPEDWPGQFLARSSALQTFDFNLNVAYRPHPRFSIAFGVNLVRGTVYIERHLNFIDSVGAVELGGGAWGFGVNGGVQFEVIEKFLFFGATLRGAVPLDFTGRAHFSDVPASFSSQLADQNISAHIELPLVASFGLGFKPMEKLRLALDITYVNWNSFRELRISFENPALTQPLAKNWWDTASVHVGAEYDVTDFVRARLGFVYDPTPSPSNTLTPDLPDATRIKVAAGVGWRHESGFKVDFGFQFVALLAQHSGFPGFAGSYGGTAEVVSLTLGYKR
jgi:long-chain fatty acid transport protein